MKSRSQSLYSQLPETAETQLAKTVSELQSEVSCPCFFIFFTGFKLRTYLPLSRCTTENTVTVKFSTVKGQGLFTLITYLF